MKIGEVSKIVGISNSAIRFYERHGLIGSNTVARAENGYRIYDPQDIEQIRLIIRFKEFGLELREIKSLLSEESKSCGNLVSGLDEQLKKCKEMEVLIKHRIQSLLAAKNSCESACEENKNVRKCCA